MTCGPHGLCQHCPMDILPTTYAILNLLVKRAKKKKKGENDFNNIFC